MGYEPVHSWDRGRRQQERKEAGRRLPGYRRELVAYVFRRIGDFHTAEDLVQETLFRALKARSSLASPKALRGWLYSIAYHVMVDWTRRRAASRRMTQGYAADPGVRLLEEGADAHVLREESRKILRRKVERLWALAEVLPSPYREIFELRYRQELSVAQIAHRLRIREGNVKVRLFRARKLLRRLALNRPGSPAKQNKEISGAG